VIRGNCVILSKPRNNLTSARPVVPEQIFVDVIHDAEIVAYVINSRIQILWRSKCLVRE